MNKMVRFFSMLVCASFSLSIEAAWTYNETAWDNKDIGYGTISDGTWTLTAKRTIKDSQMLKVYAEAGKATGPSELSPMDFTEIEGGFKVVTIGKIFGILTECKEKISELIAPDCTAIEGGTGFGFGGCSKLTKVVLSPEFSSFESKVFSSCVELAVFSPSELKVKTIPYQAFSNCKKLATDFKCDNLVTISDYAFQNCVNLKKIEAPKLEEISIKGFLDCTGLLSVKSKSLRLLGAQAFSGCTALDFDLKDLLGSPLEFLGNTNKNLKAISGSFLNCSSLNGPLVWDFPNLNPNIVHTNCFKGCTSLSSVVFKTPVDEIQDEAFAPIAPGAKIYMNKKAPKVFGARAIGNNVGTQNKGPYPKVYIDDSSLEEYLTVMSEKNCVIRKSEFNTWSGAVCGYEMTWSKIAGMMGKDDTVCSVASDVVSLIGEEKRNVSAFVIGAKGTKDAEIFCFWVIKKPRSGFSVVVR